MDITAEDWAHLTTPRTPDLTAARQARLDAQLDKLIRFDGVVRSWRGHLAALPFAYRYESTDRNGKVSRGLVLADEATDMIEQGGIQRLAYATYYEAPKLVVDSATHLPLIVCNADNLVTIEQAAS